MLLFASLLAYTVDIMSDQPEKFSPREVESRLMGYDFEHSDLKAWRDAGGTWGRLLFMAHQHPEQQAIFAGWLSEATTAYVDSFIDIAETVNVGSPSAAQSIELVSGLIALEDEQLTTRVNQLLHQEVLTPLSPQFRRRIAVPFADPDSIEPIPENEQPFSPDEARDAYLDELYLRAGSVLLESRMVTTTEPDKHRVSRKVLGAIGIGSVVALNYFAKRKKS